MAGGGSTAQSYRVGITGGFPTILDTNAAKLSVNDDYDIIAPYETPFLDAVGGFNSWVEDKAFKHDWIEEDLWTNQLAVNTTGITATDTLTVTFSVATDGTRIQVGSVLQVDDELMRVTAVAAATCTVKRGYGSTTPATHAASTTIYVVTITEEEDGDSPFKQIRTKDRPYNYMQKIETAIRLSQEAQALDQYSRTMEFERQRQEVTKNQLQMLEGAVFRGVRYAGATDADTPSMMGGVYNFITSANGAANVDLNSTALTEANLLTLNRTIITAVGENNKGEDLWVGAYARDKIYSLYENRIRTTAGERTGGGAIDRVVLPSGDMRIHYARNADPTQAILVNHKYIRVGHWKGFGWISTPLSSAGFYDREARGGVFSVEVKHVQAMGKIQEISLSS